MLREMKERPNSVRRLFVLKGWEGRFNDLIREARTMGISVRVVGNEEWSKRSQGRPVKAFLETSPFSYIAEEELFERLGQSERPMIAAFDGIYDPQNFGNILRTAACLGIDGIIIPKDRSCGVTNAAKKVSRGGFEFVSVTRATNIARSLERLKERGFSVFGLDERGDTSLFELDLSSPFVFVFGREDGLRRLTRERCDVLARIPTRKEFPSLNLATCFAIAVYEAKRQRAKAP